MVHSACLVTPGSENRANDHEGSPGNLGDPAISTEQAGRRHRHTNSRTIHGSATGADGGQTAVAPVVSPSEGNEVRRDGRQGVAAPHSTLKRGNEPSGPRGAKGSPVARRVEPCRDTEPRRRVTSKPIGRVRDSGATT